MAQKVIFEQAVRRSVASNSPEQVSLLASGSLARVTLPASLSKFIFFSPSPLSVSTADEANVDTSMVMRTNNIFICDTETSAQQDRHKICAGSGKASAHIHAACSLRHDRIPHPHGIHQRSH